MNSHVKGGRSGGSRVRRPHTAGRIDDDLLFRYWSKTPPVHVIAPDGRPRQLHLLRYEKVAKTTSSAGGSWEDVR